MQHNESTVKVYQSSEYARFKFITGNRQLNENKIKKIIKEINEGNDVLKYYPIQVREENDRLHIFDGQHRFYIAKKLKRPVHYILLEEEKSIPDIAKINSNVEKWKSTDFINCYVEQGNEHYVQLKKFVDDFGFGVYVSVQLLQLGHPGTGSYHRSDLMQQFHYGNFKVNHWEEACAFANRVLMFSDFEHCRQQGFIVALYKIQQAGLINIIDLYNQWLKNPKQLTGHHKYKEYIYNLESIYNYGKSKRVVIA